MVIHGRWTVATLKLDAAAGNRLEAYFLLALDSGMRPGELAGLHWPEVNLDAGTVTVENALTEVDGRLELKGLKTENK